MDLIAFIGDLDDKDFDWEVRDRIGNLPQKLSPDFPFAHDVFRFIKTNNDIQYKQVDWGGYICKITKENLKEIIDFLYKKNKDFYVFYSQDPLEEIKSYVSKLNDDKEYGLVVAEVG